MSDTLPGITLPDDNHGRPWWGLSYTVTSCFGARLVQGGNRLHCLADRADIRGLFSSADVCRLDQVFPLLMKQLEFVLTSSELNPRHQHTVTLYAKGLTCKIDILSSYSYVYLTAYPTPGIKNQLSRVAFCYDLMFSPRHFSIFISAYQESPQYENITCITRAGGQLSPVSC